MSRDALFDGFEAVPEPDVPKMSADRRRTLRQRRQVESGVHPLTGGRTFPDWGTCGDCRWRTLVDHHSRTYPKCWHPGTRGADEYERFGPPRHTNGAASDVRAWWPACADFELGDRKALSPDAARWRPASPVGGEQQ